ncbi:MAG: hypothetical protein JOZ24_08590 [Candidatus Eremiobacteraeota bacterium]|nr:hypothetical protein [Candidatus Eremiobacteraeota bacterium]
MKCSASFGRGAQDEHSPRPGTSHAAHAEGKSIDRSTSITHAVHACVLGR